MIVKRITAATIRDAMREVRAALGPQAVILSTRPTEEGIEVIAALEDEGDTPETDLETPPPPESARSFADFVQSVQGIRPSPPPAATKPRELAPPPPAAPEIGRTKLTSGLSPDAVKALLAKEMAARPLPAAAPSKPSRSADTLRDAPREMGRETGRVPPKTPAATTATVNDSTLTHLHDEMRALHRLVKDQLPGFAWGELARKQPHRAQLLTRLFALGMTPELALTLVDCADSPDGDTAYYQVLAKLAEGLTTTEDDILQQGGVVALIGPTGVGKTTTVAKLAARYALRHGPGQVALITTDGYRIGAFEQLNTYGLILKIPVRLAADEAALRSALDEFEHRPLVLIDTAGMSQRDVRLAAQLALIEKPAVRRYLVLAANAQTPCLEEAINAFKAPLHGCVLTKLDEASQLGGALSVLYRHQLPASYLTDGQRVPEEIQPARVETLLQWAERLVDRQATPSSEHLALTFGAGVRHVAL